MGCPGSSCHGVHLVNGVLFVNRLITLRQRISYLSNLFLIVVRFFLCCFMVFDISGGPEIPCGFIPTHLETIWLTLTNTQSQFSNKLGDEFVAWWLMVHGSWWVAYNQGSLSVIVLMPSGGGGARPMARGRRAPPTGSLQGRGWVTGELLSRIISLYRKRALWKVSMWTVIQWQWVNNELIWESARLFTPWPIAHGPRRTYVWPCASPQPIPPSVPFPPPLRRRWRSKSGATGTWLAQRAQRWGTSRTITGWRWTSRGSIPRSKMCSHLWFIVDKVEC